MKDIEGYEGLYAVDEEGNVWSYPRKWKTGIKHAMKMENKGKFINNKHKTNRGYCVINLCKNSKCTKFTLHRVIAKTFINNPLNLPNVNHKNGIKTDNRIENLEWITSKENTAHAIKNGLINVRGENSALHKLKDFQIREIRMIYKTEKITKTDLAKRYNISRSIVRRIVLNQYRKDA